MMRHPWTRQLVVLGAVVLLLLNLTRPAFATPLTVSSVACTASVTVTTTTETVLCTTAGITASTGQVIRLIALTDFTSGTGTTSLTVRFRRGATATGTLVGPQDAVQTTAGNTIARSAEAEDTPGEVSGQQYVLTVQQTAATANGTGLFTEIVALVY